MVRSHIQQSPYSLDAIAIFAGLKPAVVERIQRGCSWRRYEPGEIIVDYLDASNDVFFLTAGEARVTIYSYVGKVVSFGELGAGEVFGEYAAIDRCSRSASVQARTDCLVAMMPADAFRRLLQTTPEVTFAVLEQLVKRTRAVTNRVYEFSTMHVSSRVQAEILRLARLVPREGKSARIAPPPAHVEIASRVSTHREAVTRELTHLCRIGIIERRDDALVVRDIDLLARMVHEATGE
jgi:CRP/FNR family cyclic AMP-dependent transcriptional regulator